MCRWAVSRGIIDKNPCEGISPPTVEKPRDRVLDERELALLWQATASLEFPYAQIFRLLILTGARKGEVAGATWREFDVKKRLWTLPASRSKNHREHALPLSLAAVDILSSLPRFEGSEFVFGANGRTPSSFSDAKARFDSEVARLNGGEAIPHFTIHDIRRSVASGLASIGVQLHVIERCLNHVSGSFGGIVSVYQRHSYAEEMHSALDAWARHIEAIVTGKPADNVVELAAVRV
jgi:integrase